MSLLHRRVHAREIVEVGCNVGGDGVQRTLFEWLSFPDLTKRALLKLEPRLDAIDDPILDELINDGRYAPYVDRQQREVARMQADEAVRIPEDMDYRSIGGLSAEMIERLEAARPYSLGAAGRVRGITPAALGAILVRCRRLAA